jgi:hypothetical protein
MYQQRPTGVTTVAVLFFIAGALAILSGVYTLATSLRPGIPDFATYDVVVGIVAIFVGGLNVAVGWGLGTLQNKARITDAPVDLSGQVSYVWARAWAILRTTPRMATLLLLWTLASTIGFAPICFAIWFCPFVLIEGRGSGLWLPPVAGALLGHVLGALQWLVLRRRIRRAGWWAFVSAPGLAAGLTVSLYGWAFVWRIAGDFHSSGSLGGATVAGVAIGLSQWLVLHGQIPRTAWWVLASVVATVAAMTIQVALFHPRSLDEVPGVLAVLAGGAVYGAITGFVLVWLLRHSLSETPSQQHSTA